LLCKFIQPRLAVLACFFIYPHHWVQGSDDRDVFYETDILERFCI
jgi:hypothetical protein